MLLEVVVSSGSGDLVLVRFGFGSGSIQFGSVPWACHVGFRFGSVCIQSRFRPVPVRDGSVNAVPVRFAAILN